MATAKPARPITTHRSRKPVVNARSNKPGGSRRTRAAGIPTTATIERSLLELIRRTSCDLPADVEDALRKAQSQEAKGTRAHSTLAAIRANITLARANGAPLCQDTGTLLFHVQAPEDADPGPFTAAAKAAVSAATRAGQLRQNTIDAVTGDPYPLNLASGSPQIDFERAPRDTYDVRLVMKGGGSENVSRQYSLPDDLLGADRTLEGVRRCILDAIVRAQGHGCAPGILGVCIGGDRAQGFICAKQQFLRKLDDHALSPPLTGLENRIMRDALQLGVGPMGLGGRTTILAVKIGSLSRLPASFFVTVSYMCWAMRRRGVLLDAAGGIRRWLY